jgi:hypothetical protein
MKKYILYIVFVSIVVVGSGWMIVSEKTYCEADGTQVCYNQKENKFNLENNATLTIYLKNQEQKDYLLSALARDIVDYNLTLDIKIDTSVSAWEAIHELDADIFYTQENEAAMIYNELMVMELVFSDRLSFEGIDHFATLLNREGIRFVPSSYEGLLFAYNETLLEELGFDTSNKDDKNRIVGLSEWKDAIELSKQWNENRPDTSIASIFPFTVAEPWQFYPFLTAGGWHMFSSNKASEPGFDSIEFFDALVFVDELFNSKLTFDEQDELAWRFEDALLNKDSLFSLATDWLDWEAISLVNEQEYSYSAFLDYKQTPLTPLVRVDGLVVKNNPYPSLSNRIFEVLTRDQNTQILLESTKDNLVIAKDKIEIFQIEEKRKEKIQAYMYSVSEPLVALEDNPQILGWEYYLEGRVHKIILEVFNKNITIEQAQLQLVEDYKIWYDQNNQKVDGNNE